MTSSPTGPATAAGRAGGTWVAGRALLDSLMDAGLVPSIGGPLATSWWHKIGTALGERGYHVVPIEAEAARPDLLSAAANYVVDVWADLSQEDCSGTNSMDDAVDRLRTALAASPEPAADGLDVTSLRNLARSIRSSDLFRRQRRSLLDSEKPTWAQIVALVDFASALHEPSRKPGEEG